MYVVRVTATPHRAFAIDKEIIGISCKMGIKRICSNATIIQVAEIAFSEPDMCSKRM
jgi:hypothetical protein